MPQLIWLITGCASGFGELFVTEALSRGDKVIATGRSASTRLSHLRDLGASILDLDVTLPQPEIDAIIAAAIAIYGHIDVLVNNAGYGELGLAEGISKEQYINQLSVNFLGPVAVTNALLPHFRSRKSGKIAFTNSIWGIDNEPLLTPYACSKHALSAYALGLHHEVSQFGISSITFFISHFRTKIREHAPKSFDPEKLADYIPMMSVLLQTIPTVDGCQPGDPVKGVRLMVDVLREEGVAQGKKMPHRMAVGADAVVLSRLVAEEKLREIEELGDVGKATDLDEPKKGLWTEFEKKGVVRSMDL